MNCHHRKIENINNKGFTMVEVLVTIVLFVIVTFIVVNFMITSGNFFKLNTDKADAQSQARLIFQGLTKDLATAKEVQIVDTVATTLLVVPTGKIGYQVEKNMLVSIDGTSGNKSPAYNNFALEFMKFEFVPKSDNLLKIIMTANGGAVFETEVYSPNIAAFSKVPTELTTGNAIVIVP